ncbi:hypothetical protein IC582_001592 [Cucumis melo]
MCCGTCCLWGNPMKCLCGCQSTDVGEPKTKRNLLENASNLLTNLLSGGNLGSMLIAEEMEQIFALMAKQTEKFKCTAHKEV